MQVNTDNLFAVIGTNLPDNRPTSDFYSLNSYSDVYATEDAVTEVNHYSQAYKSLELVNVPTYGTFAFFTHTGMNTVRFSQIEARYNVLKDVIQLESVRFQTEAERIDGIKYLTLKYAILGKYLLVSRSPNTGTIISVYG